MDREPTEDNAASRKRLEALVHRLTVADLTHETARGWTVAAALARLAFWDRWAEHLIGRWRSGQMPPPTMPDWYDEAHDATAAPIWCAVPAQEAARLAVEAARSVDMVIARVETPVETAILRAGERHLLDRGIRRTETLDAIEATLRR